MESQEGNENKKDTKIRDDLYRVLGQSLPKKLGLMRQAANPEDALNGGDPSE